MLDLNTKLSNWYKSKNKINREDSQIEFLVIAIWFFTNNKEPKNTLQY